MRKKTNKKTESIFVAVSSSEKGNKDKEASREADVLRKDIKGKFCQKGREVSLEEKRSSVRRGDKFSL